MNHAQNENKPQISEEEQKAITIFQAISSNSESGRKGAKPMTAGWIETAIENGGVMTLSKNVHGTKASMNWKHREKISGDYFKTIQVAISSLDSALCDDAANEMVEEGVV